MPQRRRSVPLDQPDGAPSTRQRRGEHRADSSGPDGPGTGSGLNSPSVHPARASHRSRSRGFCFTVPNYSAADVEVLQTICPGWCQYLVFQKEVCPTTQTPHIQGYLYFSQPKDWGHVSGYLRSQRSIGNLHLESARGSVDSNVEYCTKEDSRQAGDGAGPFEYGTRPGGQGKRTDLDVCASDVLSGLSPAAVGMANPSVFVKYHKGLTALASLLVEPRDFKTRVAWFHGPTGTGKSHTARERGLAVIRDEYPGDLEDPVRRHVYYKMGGNKWWDGYLGHKVVIIDDFRPEMCSFDELLRLFDKYPFRVEFKGGSIDFVARYIFVTSPKSPREYFGVGSEDVEQLMRRIEEVVHFNDFFNN